MRKGLWFVVTFSAFAILVLDWFTEALPAWAPLAGAVTVTTTYSYALGSRSGGRKWLCGLLGLLLGLAASLSNLPVVSAGVAAATAVVAAVLAVMVTVPSRGTRGVAREVVIAVGFATVGSFAVAAYRPVVSFDRFSYLVLGAAMLGSLALVYRLGAGFHGLGRRGYLVVGTGLALIVVTLAYTEALTRWGTPELIATIDEAETWLRNHLGAVPRPIEVLLGIPAVAWGSHMRARRRQGWWVCAFGVAATAPITCALLEPGRSLFHAALGTAYGVLLGFALGYLVIRADTFLTGPRGRRARQEEAASALRPEPARTLPLL